jgi:aerobic-type carbon monoxide dehydrogenase small subunit (CoxS/CutS family)
MIKFTLNGQDVSVDVEDDTPLLWVLRDTLGFTGTKYGCGITECGACTVHLNGEAVRSCGVAISAAEGAHITTIEGLSTDASHPVQRAWVIEQVPQCGYCQSGMIMATAAFLSDNPEPKDADIDAGITNICRCGTYPRIRRAVHLAASFAQDDDQ